MREIKFRVRDSLYRITEYQFIKYVCAEDGTEFKIVAFIFHDDVVTLADVLKDESGRYKAMQFTGFKDKNGKEIYEGDVLTKDGHHNRIVIWEKDAWVAKYFDDEYKTKARLHTFVHNCEVIGNKYEV